MNPQVSSKSASHRTLRAAAAAVLSAAVLAAPCTAQEVTETRSLQNADEIHEITSLAWMQPHGLGFGFGLTSQSRRRFGLEREQFFESGPPQPTIGVRYRFSGQNSISVNAIVGRLHNASPTSTLSDASFLSDGFVKKSPSFVADIRSGLRFQMDSDLQMQVKARRDGVKFVLRKKFY